MLKLLGTLTFRSRCPAVTLVKNTSSSSLSTYSSTSLPIGNPQYKGISTSWKKGKSNSCGQRSQNKQELLRNTFIGNRYPLIDQTQTRCYSNHSSLPDKLIPEEISEREFEGIVDESLESLYTYFDEIIESSPCVNDGDVSFGSGVLTIKLGKHGTYVINKQTPNKQIWLSSPTSGPKRYDFINKTWIYRHDGMSLFQLLNIELPTIVGLEDVDFEKHCSYGKAI